MRKKLAILGHLTRGKEVIELLEMMGGSNIHNLSGNDIYSYYIIKGFKNEISDELYIFGNEDTYHFTLEKFLEKYPFKIGDKVIDTADGCTGVVNEMKWDEDVSDMKYYVAFENRVDFGWFTNDSINFFEINKNENLEENKFPPFEPMFKMNDELEYKAPDGYEITEASKDKVFIKPIKPKYPTTYAECCKNVLGLIHWGMTVDVPMHYSPLILNFTKLLICRDAYWKIAGEELELGEPWKPDWTNLDQLKYCIWVDVGEFITMINVRGQHILAFPTEEMRDAFYENFKDLIEQCKEFL